MLKCSTEIGNLQLTCENLTAGMTIEVKRVIYLESRAITNSNTPLHVKSGIASLMFRVHAGVLFNEIFMNNKIKFTRQNIGDLERKIRYVLAYFTKWYDCRNARKLDKDMKKYRMWGKSVMSSVTYYIMFLGSLGFLGYCKYMLNTYPKLQFIIALHSNTSSIESHFSLMRWYGADTPQI